MGDIEQEYSLMESERSIEEKLRIKYRGARWLEYQTSSDVLNRIVESKKPPRSDFSLFLEEVSRIQMCSCDEINWAEVFRYYFENK